MADELVNLLCDPFDEGDSTERILVKMMLEAAESGKSTWTCYMAILERKFPNWQRKRP